MRLHHTTGVVGRTGAARTPQQVQRELMKPRRDGNLVMSPLEIGNGQLSDCASRLMGALAAPVGSS
jgi:hypothetical protein